jgi:predicted transcriptional regulator
VVSITIDDRDRAMLEPLRDGAADVESLARAADCSPGYARSRLPDLADNGLVRRADDAGTYAITDSGKRVVAGSPAGAMDDRIDTPPAVEERIESFDLRPDREEAVRNAFSFLRYWGEATASEIVDAVYPENLAGFESRDAWWTEFLRVGSTRSRECNRATLSRTRGGTRATPTTSRTPTTAVTLRRTTWPRGPA